ncbi:hypothetical protein RND71_015011 [Anisodus tanguticus]|uniref:Uncharacterized protein n=1 Tax=Anisodus tanguticus TaxID=243964 RepID=A0AAE1SDV2_9SOLA|nr:hypothetical protein RND71_015011 [Anisodus tanguticus]
MEEDADKVIASLLGSNDDKHQVITNNENQLAVVNEVNYEVRTNCEASTSTSKNEHEDYGELGQASNYLEAGVEQFNGINPYEDYSYDDLIND